MGCDRICHILISRYGLCYRGRATGNCGGLILLVVNYTNQCSKFLTLLRIGVGECQTAIVSAVGHGITIVEDAQDAAHITGGTGHVDLHVAGGDGMATFTHKAYQATHIGAVSNATFHAVSLHIAALVTGHIHVSEVGVGVLAESAAHIGEAIHLN